MQSATDKPDEATDASGDPGDDETGDYSGFLIMRLRIGEEILIGDTLVMVKETTRSKVHLAIKAKRSTQIKKL